MFGLKRFRIYLYGRHFTIWTDHKPLQRIFGQKIAIPALAVVERSTPKSYVIVLSDGRVWRRHIDAKG